MRKAIIVWNKARNEGVVFLEEDADDARLAATGINEPKAGKVGYNSLADTFWENYGDEVAEGESLPTEEIEVGDA